MPLKEEYLMLINLIVNVLQLQISYQPLIAPAQPTITIVPLLHINKLVMLNVKIKLTQTSQVLPHVPLVQLLRAGLTVLMQFTNV